MKANRVALSFGFLADGHKRSDGVKELTKIDLFEVSVVPAPANPATRFLDLKGVGEEPERDWARELGLLPESEAHKVAESSYKSLPVRFASFKC